MAPTTMQRAAATPRRPVPVGSTDERVLALLETRGPSCVAEICEALQLGQLSAALSLDRLRQEGAARVSDVTRRNAEVWETAESSLRRTPTDAAAPPPLLPTKPPPRVL